MAAAHARKEDSTPGGLQLPRTAPSTRQMGPLVAEAAATQAGPEGVRVEVGVRLRRCRERGRG